MCDPVSLALASTAATVVGAGGTLVNSLGAQKAAKQQQREVSIWQQQQKKNRDASFARQQELRDEANRSREAGLDQLEGQDQNKRQAEEEAELAKQLTGETIAAQPEAGAPLSASDAALAAENTTPAGGDSFQKDLAAALNTSTKGARQRMQALAGVQSFGNVMDQNKDILNRSGADIDMFNEFRRGELGVLDAQQAVDPVQVSYTPSPWADAFSTALQAGAQGLGNISGGGGTGTLVGGAGTGIKSDPWANLRHTSLPKYAPVPPPRVF
jgi:hypothetical protein